MRTVTLTVDSRELLSARFIAAMKGAPQGAYITFASTELLFQILTPQRWNILQVMTGAKPLSLEQLTLSTGRDKQAVHHDVQALLDVGVLEGNADANIEFPYDAVHVDFMILAS
jgi:predicted transcriptional regulator